MADREVRVTFRVSDDGTLNVLDSAGAKLRTVGRAADELGSRGASGFGKFAASIITANQAIDLASRAVHALRSGLGLVVNAADESDRAILRLNTALQGSGQYTAAYSMALQDVATRLQGMTTYSDEAILGLEQFLVTAGVKGPQQIEQFSRAVLGLAEFLGKDLGQATMAMSGMLGGNFTMMERALRPLGVRFAENTSNAEKYAVIMGKLVPLFSYATAGATTFSGRIAQMRNIVGDLLEPIGKVITQSSAWEGIFGTLRTEIERLTARTTAWVEANRSVIDEKISGFFTNLPGYVDRASSAMVTLAEKTGTFVGWIGTLAGYLESHPKLAEMLGGAAVGGRVAGLPGAIVGGAAAPLVGPAYRFGQEYGAPAVAAYSDALAASRARQEKFQADYARTRESVRRWGASIPESSGLALAPLSAHGVAPLTSDAFVGPPAPATAGMPGWSFAADPEAAKKAAETAKKALEEQQKDTLALMQAEETRRTIAVASAEFAAKAAKDRGASYAEQIALAGALDAAEMRVLETQRDQAAVAVAQAIEAGKGAGEVERLAAEWQKVDAAIDRGTTHMQEMSDEARKAQEELRKAQHVTLNLGSSLETGVGRAIEGLFAGGRGVNLGAIMKDASTSMATEFATGLLKAEMAKGQFDQKVSENFSVTLPGFMKTGATAISSTWNALFSDMASTTASGTGGILGLMGRFVSTLGGLLRNIPGLGSIGNLGGLAGTGGAVSVSDTVGGIGLGMPTLTMRSTMPSLMGLLGAGGAGVGVGSMLSGLLGGGMAGSVLGGAGGGALAGMMLGGPIGALGGALVGALGGALADLFSKGAGPTQEHVNLDSIKQWVTKAGIRQAGGTLGGRSTWGDHSTIDRVYPGLTDVGGVQSINNAILAVMTAGLGNDKGQAGMATNAIANNANLLHESLDRVKNDLRSMADTAGVTLEVSLAKLQEQFDTGYITLNRFTDQVGVLTDVFQEDLPAALNAGAVAAKNMADGVLDITGYMKDLAMQKTIITASQDAGEAARMAGVGLMSPSRARAAQQQQLDLIRYVGGQAEPGTKEHLAAWQQMQQIGQWFMGQSSRRWQQYGLSLMQEAATGMKSDIITDPIDTNTQAITTLTSSVETLTQTMIQLPDWLGGGNIPINIPGMASGGIVTRPTFAMLGEAGPEAVIPLSRSRASAHGGGSDDQLAEAIASRLARVLREDQRAGDTLNAEINIEGVREPREAADHAVNMLMTALNDWRVRRRVREVAVQG